MGYFEEYTEKDREQRDALSASEEAPEEEAVAEEEEVEEESTEVETEEPQVEEETEEPQAPADKKVYEITYEDEDGEEVTEKLTQEQIAEYISKAKTQDSASLEEFVTNVRPLIDRVSTSPLLQQVLKWQDDGYSEVQIMQGLANHVAQQTGVKQAPQQEPEDDGMDESQRAFMNQLLKNVENVINNRLGPVQNKVAQTEKQRQEEAMMAYNEKVFEQALDKYYYKPDLLSEGQRRKLAKAIRDAFPNSDLRAIKLQPTTAEMIVGYALGPRKGAVKAKKEAKQFAQQAAAPTIMPGVGMKTKNIRPDSTPRVNTIAGRRNAFQELINGTK